MNKNFTRGDGSDFVLLKTGNHSLLYKVARAGQIDRYEVIQTTKIKGGADTSFKLGDEFSRTFRTKDSAYDYFQILEYKLKLKTMKNNEKINLVRVKQILDRLKDIEANPFKIRASIEEPEFTPHVEPDPARWLYFFQLQYLYIENIKLKSLVEVKSDAEVTVLLKKYKTNEEMPVCAAYLPDTEQILPEALKNYPDLKIITVLDAAALSNQIYMTTGVRIDPEKLSNKELIAFMKLPLSAKEKIFMSRVDHDKQKTETRDRILKCLQIADEKQKNECIKNCKK